VAKAANATVQTQPGMFVGKFSYAAPEQVKGGAVDARSDVFAAGIMLWQAIAGRPFSDRSPTPEACRARIEGLEPRIAQVVPTVDPVLARICDRALAVDPERRYASAKELRAELSEYMQRVGVRIEAAEIGQLMQELFASERRALHVRIEQAMRRAGESHNEGDALPILQLADKEPTTVADLSSLVQVSLEQDDDKIQEGYASSSSKIRLFGKSSWRSAIAHLVHGSRSRLLLVGVLPAAVLVGSLAALLAPRAQTRRELDSKASFATNPPPSATSLEKMAPLTTPQLTAVTDGATPASSVIVPALDPAPESNKDRPTRKLAEPTGRSAVAQRSRTRPARTPSAAPRETSEPPAASVPAAPQPRAPALAPQRVYEEGADLPFTRRPSNLRIDSENPYQ